MRAFVVAVYIMVGVGASFGASVGAMRMDIPWESKIVGILITGIAWPCALGARLTLPDEYVDPALAHAEFHHGAGGAEMEVDTAPEA